jgi:N-methylhydantoinase A/oxoprolinase/acetone carboxylase beta subunit
MERAWVAKIADSIEAYTRITPDTVLAAFGGGGPLVVCRVAEAAGITRVIIPGLAAVFSAFGLGFSDIAHHYEAPLASGDASGLERAQASLIDRARRDMAGEGFALADCRIEWSLTVSADGTERVVRLPAAVLPEGLPPRAKLSLTLEVAKPIPQPSLSGDFEGAHAVARAAGTRRVLIGSDRVDVPLYRVEDQVAGAHAAGPAVLEEAYFTCRIDPGWSFRINAAGDIRLDRT